MGGMADEVIAINVSTPVAGQLLTTSTALSGPVPPLSSLNLRKSLPHTELTLASPRHDSMYAADEMYE